MFFERSSHKHVLCCRRTTIAPETVVTRKWNKFGQLKFGHVVKSVVRTEDGKAIKHLIKPFWTGARWPLHQELPRRLPMLVTDIYRTQRLNNLNLQVCILLSCITAFKNSQQKCFHVLWAQLAQTRPLLPQDNNCPGNRGDKKMN
jgi:hypothetical protein